VLLKALAEFFLKKLRASDIVCRYGGDEFVLLLPHATAEEAAVAAQRISDEFRQSSAGILSRQEGVTMSVGVGSLARHQPSGAEQLVAKADKGLYEAKAAGRNKIVCPQSPATTAAA
ncbi:MAG TPA: GGDEF domain-containing protein, partial [Tepidisphaeraceae bacterium]|nr:GGDEF domain-containing protein [Tepidisphaeraceae bacterium]